MYFSSSSKINNKYTDDTITRIKAFEKACGHAIPYVIAPRRPGDIATCYAKADKAEKELGWTAKLGIDEMCSSLWNWQSKNPDGYNTKK